MHTSNPTIPPVNNKLLAQINPGLQDSLMPKLKQITFEAGSIINQPGQDDNCVYLPIDMLVYQVLMLDNGATSGLAIIGNEGIISPYALTEHAADNCTFKVLKSGSAFQLPVTVAREFFGIDAAMYQPVLDFVAKWMRQINQTAVYLPVDAIISIQTLLKDGASGEVAIIGNEGMVGISTFIGACSTTSTAVVRSAGKAFEISGQAFYKHFQNSPDMRSKVLHYTLNFIDQIAQSSICSQHHNIRQRLSRWLLMAGDRANSDTITVTQEAIAQSLGVRR